MTGQQIVKYLDRPTQGKIAYNPQGSGPLVMLVPGMGALRSTYRFLSPVLVAAGYTVVTADLRGHGESSSSFSSYGDVDTAGDVEALLRELALPAVLACNSMAAGAAVIVAAEHPELVTGLVLIGPFVRQPSNSAIENVFFYLLMARPWAAAFWKAHRPKLYAGRKPADFVRHHEAAITDMKRPGFARAFSLTTRTGHVKAEDSLAAVTAPTLVVVGENDPDFMDPQAEAEWIGRTLRGSVTMAPDAGHYPHSQQP
jgi:pimeloyl-ACP methyl ester carboxylesterase